MESDKETLLQLRKARLFQELLRKGEWQPAKDELLETISGLLNISSLDLEKPSEEVKFQAKLNSEIVRILYNWIGSIETTATMTANPGQEPDYIIRNIER